MDKVKVKVFDLGWKNCIDARFTRMPCIGETIMFGSNPFPNDQAHGVMFKVVSVNHWVEVDEVDGVQGDITVKRLNSQ